MEADKSNMAGLAEYRLDIGGRGRKGVEVCFTGVGSSSAPLSPGLARTMIIQNATDNRVGAKRSISYFIVLNIHNWIGLQYRKDSCPEALDACSTRD